MFNSSNFAEINYLNFDADFSINLGSKIKIILGPNGTGKTSIYKNIKKRFSDYSFIDYDDVEKSVIANKYAIVIGASIVDLDNKIKEKQNLIDSINIKENLKIFNITNKDSSEGISKNLEIKRKNPELAIEQFKNENLNNIFNMEDNYRDFFNKNAKKIIEVKEIKAQLDDIKNNFKKHILDEINNYLDDDDFVCPVCGLTNTEPIKMIIAKKLSKLKYLDEEIVNSYQKLHSDMKPEKILNDIRNIKSIIEDNNISIENFENYLICGGDKEKANTIIECQRKLKELNKEIQNLEAEKEQFYNTLKDHKEDLDSTFQLQFNAKKEDINFNDMKKEISIKLPRKVQEYSTGEINLMTFIICILEFISSNKKYLIIDDPLSSYDIPNQYRIMYEIVCAKSNDKNILIFTHNIDTINIANTQYNSLFEYEVLEKRKDTLYLNRINYSSTTNILSIQELKKHISQNYNNINYINLLTKKETWNDENPDEYENHLIFHYDEPFQKNIDSIDYTNDYLANLIDNFDDNTFQNKSYLENTADKIIYTTALRIWIEKQFYINSNNDLSLHRKQFGDKIKYMFSNNRWTGSPKVTRKYLMSKKVMLNQHIHQQSQVMPFYYVLNLTLDDISKEINDIKEHFTNGSGNLELHNIGQLIHS